jgi:hypothetical protein
VKSGDLPAHRIGQQLRVGEAELRAFLTAGSTSLEVSRD